MITYQEYTDKVLPLLNVRCGDIIELRLSSKNLTETPPQTAIRCVGQFTRHLGLLPQQLAISPAHFEQLTSRAIDVIWYPEEHPDAEGVNGATVPVKIPYFLDETLVLGTVAARYEVPLCEHCCSIADGNLAADLVDTLQTRGFEVIGQTPGTITMSRVIDQAPLLLEGPVLAQESEEGQ